MMQFICCHKIGGMAKS